MSLAVLAVMSPAFGYTEAFPPLDQTLTNLSAAQAALEASVEAQPAFAETLSQLAMQEGERTASLSQEADPATAEDRGALIAVIEQNNELFDSELSQAIIRELVTTLPAELAAEQAR